MKYYIYISKTKVDMLFPQIPASYLEAVEAEVGLNLGVLSASLKRGVRAEASTELPARLETVCRYIERHEKVGSLESPSNYIYGKLPLRQGRIWNNLAFFGAIIRGKTLGLVGSDASIIGAPEIPLRDHRIRSYMEDLSEREALISARNPNQEFHDPWSLRETIKQALYHITPPRLSDQDLLSRLLSSSISSPDIGATDLAMLEFFAKVIHQEPDLVVATPLYVAEVHD